MHIPHLSPTPIRCKGSLSLPVGSHCCAGTDLPYWRRRYGAIRTLERDFLCAVCPSRSLLHTSPLGVLSVAKCFSYRPLLCTSQLLSMCPWSSKGTVQTSSPSSVNTVMFSPRRCGYTMGQWRVVKSLALPSLVQVTLFSLEQNTLQPLLEWTMYERWMDTSSNVHMMIWATSSRAMLSSSPLSLLVSACAVYKPHFMMYSHVQCIPMHQQLVVYSLVSCASRSTSGLGEKELHSSQNWP